MQVDRRLAHRARDATATRESLVRAAAELFAERGADAARSRDIVKAAGQANGSAIGYHFGSRQGLLEAILDRHIDQMSDRAGVLGRRVPGPLRGTALSRQLELIDAALAPALPEQVRGERLAAVILLLAATLADRARRVDRGRRLALDHQSYVADLVAMCSGALQAPAESATDPQSADGLSPVGRSVRPTGSLYRRDVPPSMRASVRCYVWHIPGNGRTLGRVLPSARELVP
ncbi:MAG TPA: helix-turn-helix domain-containing protein [Nocardioidaceae bacterium]|nr:helix-turn-helix domain-containing protein [Nocardioidaceae bacterium]